MKSLKFTPKSNETTKLKFNLDFYSIVRTRNFQVLQFLIKNCLCGLAV